MSNFRPPGTPLHEPGVAGPHFAGHSVGRPGQFPPCSGERPGLAEPTAFFAITARAMSRYLIEVARRPYAKFVLIEGIEDSHPADNAKLSTSIAVDRLLDELAKIKTGVVQRVGGTVFPRAHR
jgi:hypothetical protein